MGREQGKAAGLRDLSAFIGTYDVSRSICDQLTNSESRFEGHAEISRTPEGAQYCESGVLILNGQRFQAERSYLWCEDAGRIWVRFADGAAFHDFDPEAGGRASAHLCGEDKYRASYDFSQWRCWGVRFAVQGPRKDYVSQTWYVRR